MKNQTWMGSMYMSSSCNMLMTLGDESGDVTCDHHFKAAAAAKTYDDKIANAGIVAGLCRHDNCLRMFDIPQTGERLRYALRILEDILKDPNCPKYLVLMYDIGCKFEKYIKV